jgi:hypothetical protein
MPLTAAASYSRQNKHLTGNLELRQLGTQPPKRLFHGRYAPAYDDRDGQTVVIGKSICLNGLNTRANKARCLQ